MDTDTRNFVLLRDGGCVARFVNNTFEASRWPMLQGLPDPGRCRSIWGDPQGNSMRGLELDHVEKANELSFATKPPDDPDHLWTMCGWHHRGSRAGSTWATREQVRSAARDYIVAANAVAHHMGWPIWHWPDFAIP